MEKVFSKLFWNPTLKKLKPSSVLALLLLSEKAMEWQTNQLQKKYRQILLSELDKSENTVDNIIADLRKHQVLIKGRGGNQYLNPYIITRSPNPQAIIDYLEGRTKEILGTANNKIKEAVNKKKDNNTMKHQPVRSFNTDDLYR